MIPYGSKPKDMRGKKLPYHIQCAAVTTQLEAIRVPPQAAIGINQKKGDNKDLKRNKMSASKTFTIQRPKRGIRGETFELNCFTYFG